MNGASESAALNEAPAPGVPFAGGAVAARPRGESLIRRFGRTNARGIASAIGAAATVLAVSGIAIGSHGFRYFDFALAPYAAVCALAVGFLGRRAALWFSRPATARLFANAARRVRERRAANGLLATVRALAAASLDVYGAQNFIRRRGASRWAGHLLLAGGAASGFALTFPLVFGWIHFETPADARVYRVAVFGIPAGVFAVDSVLGWVAFNALNLSAVATLAGVSIAGFRRIARPAEFAGQSLWEDGMPLILLAAVAATGLGLTASSRMAGGAGYSLVAAAHLGSVVALLVYLPYGKFLHVVQRSAHLAATLVRERDEARDARCVRCSEPYAPAAQIEDLKAVLGRLGLALSFDSPGGSVHYQDVCPRCRRALLALNQGASLGDPKWRR